MEKQIVNLEDIKITIPYYYQKVEPLPSDPANSVSYMVQTEHAICFAQLSLVDESEMLPRTKKSLIAGVRKYLDDNQGLVQVEVYDDYLYTIVKTLQQPSGVQYILTYQKFYPEVILNIQAFFEEAGTTGIRDNLIYSMCRKHNVVGSAEDPFRGWAQDPYDDTVTKGALMNLSEQEMYDDKFSGFPLSMCREFVRGVL